MRFKRWVLMTALFSLVVLVSSGLGARPAAAVGFPTVTTISSSSNPSAACGSVTFTVTVNGALFPASPEGVVQLFDGASPLGGPQLITPDFDPDPIFGTHIVPTNHSSATLSVSLSGGNHMITAVYGGFDLPSSGGPFLQNVSAASSSTLVSSSVNPSVFGQPVVLRAAVSSACSASVAGMVQFKTDGAPLGAPQRVDGSGHAQVSTSTLSVAGHLVTADFTSTNSDVASSAGALPGPQVVNPADTATAVTPSVNPSEYGAPVTFTASTTVSAPGSGTATGTVQFQESGSALGSPAGVGADGQSAFTTNVLSVGNHEITGAFSSDSPNFKDSSGALVQTVNRARTTLTYNGSVTADYNDPFIASAVLSRTDTLAPIEGKVITLAMGAESCSPVTDSQGVASCTLTPSESASIQTMTAIFGDDANYVISTDATAFTVTKEETTTLYTGPAVIAQGQPVTLSGRLLEDGTTPIAGRVLTLRLGSGALAQTCVTPATDASGTATCTIPVVTVTQGAEQVAATFPGDGYYLASADTSHNVIIFAFPSGGIFTLGDITAAAAPPAITFWGSQWASQNLLSTGTAPAAFKGFADSTSTQPPSCGATWTTSPGNSASPVGSLPAYMGTAVVSSITKHGSTITGNIVKIVVVVTAPGYVPNPGRPGTGTVVATYCG